MGDLKESFRSRLMRLVFLVHPAYGGTGGKVRFIASDWSEVRLEVPLNWRTRNYVGTIFGGSMYGAVDPMYMIMLIQRLGDEYVVWDKAASIRFLKPGRSRLSAVFRVTDDEIAQIKQILASNRSCDRVYTVELVDKNGVVCASVEKVIYISLRTRYNHS